MTKKPQIILDVEKEVGFELKEVKLEEVSKVENNKSFSKNENGKITGLNFDNQKISNINSLTHLKELKALSLYKTQVSDVSALKGLTNLQILYLGNTQVSDLSALKGLNKLTQLWLESTDVSDVSDLKGLTNLTRLHLNSTQVSDLSALKGLNKLTQLGLSSTQVSDVSALSELPKLRTLDVRHCKIKSISLEIAEKFNFVEWSEEFQIGLNLYGNPIEDFLPAEFINQGQKAVIAYLQSKGIERVSPEKEQERSIPPKPDLAPLNEVKTLIIGGGGCGKTSLMRQLMGQKFNPKEDQTHGIRILKHEIDYNDKENTTIDVHFWDFGGQEINHATHQVFYSKRSLYLLVLDARQDERAEYWLKYIENLGGDSPILVVLNKIDENPAFEVNRRFLWDKHPNIKAFYRVSCSTDEGMEDLQKAVRKELYDMELRKMQLAPSWFAVKEALTNMEENYISYDRYFEICDESGVIDTTAREVLRELIHDLGLALDFKKLRRYDKQVLNPKWITNGVYRIINSPQVGGAGQGVLRFGALDSILHDWARYKAEDDQKYRYPEKTHPYITGIMQEFELCYELGNDEYIVPDLLPVQEPAGLDYAAHPLHFVIRYEDLLPRSVMPRFMVKMHRLIPSGAENRWRTGVVLRGGIFKANAIIRADNEEKEIHVWTRGKDARRMLSFIRGTFNEIRSDFEKLDVSEWLVIQEKNAAKKQKAVLAEYEALTTCDTDNNGVYFCHKLRQKFDTKDLLNGIETPESRAKLPKIRAFISYSHKDEDLKDEFKAHLKPLTYEYGLDLWDDREIDAGEQWEDEIIAHLERDSLIFLLISSAALDSDYIWQKEIPKAIQRHNTGKAIVIPVILRPCAWTGLDFGKIQAIPKEGKPITTWENQDSAWLDAVRQIETVLKGERLEGLRGRRF